MAISGALAGAAQPVGAAQPIAAASESAAELPRAWTVRVGPAGSVAMPVIYRDKAFTTDASLVTAVGLAGGNVRWQVDHTDPQFGPLYLGEPSLVGGQIWAPWSFAKYGGVMVHDPKTGEFTMSSGTTLSIGHVVTNRGRRAALFGAVIPGLALLALDDGGLPGLIDLTSSGFASYSDPVFAGSHVWVGYGGSLLRFDQRVCEPPPVDIPYCMPNAHVPLADAVVGVAGASDDKVVATTVNGVVHVFNGLNGVELWRATPGGKLATPAVVGDVVAVGGSDGKVHAYDVNGCNAAVCRALWSGDAGSPIATAPAIGNGFVFVGTDTGTVVAFAVGGCASGTCAPVAIGHAKKPSVITGDPVVGGDRVVVGTADGHLVAFSMP